MVTYPNLNTKDYMRPNEKNKSVSDKAETDLLYI